MGDSLRVEPSAGVCGMELSEVVRRRRMVRDLEGRALPVDVLRRILASALRAPSAGYAQGLELMVLDRSGDVDRFWRLTDPWSRKRREGAPAPPVIVIPLANKVAYLDRYSEPDKRGLGMDVETGWPVPYWELDVAMAVMLMLLTAVDEGVGAWFFGIFHGERELAEWLSWPSGCRPIGALALGYPAPAEEVRGSARARRRRRLDDVVHRGGWSR